MFFNSCISPLKQWFSKLKYSVLKYINTHDVVTLCEQSVYLETAHTYQIENIAAITVLLKFKEYKR